MIREAQLKDVEAIVQLVNRAYRPAPNQQGWTHEANLVAGARINTQQVVDLIKENNFQKLH